MADTDPEQRYVGVSSRAGHPHPGVRAEGCDRVRFPRLAPSQEGLGWMR